MNRFVNIAKLTRQKRQEVGLSQSELSALLGYKNGQFTSNVERGLCSVSLKALNKYKDALKLSDEELQEALVSDYKEHIKETLEKYKVVSL